jgi:hypothetical protein
MASPVLAYSIATALLEGRFGDKSCLLVDGASAS